MNDKLPVWARGLPWELIGKHSTLNGLDGNLVAAICYHETLGDSMKVRYEPAWRYTVNPRDWASKLGISGATEEVLQSCSWGMMQVMGSVFREMGYTGQLVALTSPEIGIRYGCMKLKQLSQQYTTEAQIVSAYNQGSPRKTPGGMFLNQKTYVDPVFQLLGQLRSLLPLP